MWWFCCDIKLDETRISQKTQEYFKSKVLAELKGSEEKTI
jgi:hypothetical protein